MKNDDDVLIVSNYDNFCFISYNSNNNNNVYNIRVYFNS
jgi:hypothetical protein